MISRFTNELKLTTCYNQNNHLMLQIYTKCHNGMCNQATSSLYKPSQIYACATADTDPDIQWCLPLEENVERSLPNQRKVPPVSQFLADSSLIYFLSLD